MGDLRQYPSGAKAIKSNDMLHIIEVIPDTIGQFTGLTDKNGVKIFEGDIVRLNIAGVIFNAVCKFYSGSFGLVWHYMGVDRWQAFIGMCHVEYEVIGNIYDNPELMGT
jgi:uncharacterized phage protein (TIGR01671 family)